MAGSSASYRGGLTQPVWLHPSHTWPCLCHSFPGVNLMPLKPAPPLHTPSGSGVCFWLGPRCVLAVSPSVLLRPLCLTRSLVVSSQPSPLCLTRQPWRITNESAGCSLAVLHDIYIFKFWLHFGKECSSKTTLIHLLFLLFLLKCPGEVSCCSSLLNLEYFPCC